MNAHTIALMDLAVRLKGAADTNKQISDDLTKGCCARTNAQGRAEGFYFALDLLQDTILEIHAKEGSNDSRKRV